VETSDPLALRLRHNLEEDYRGGKIGTSKKPQKFYNFMWLSYG
jgi:hypothetical protein